MLLIVSSPSGAGKSTLCSHLRSTFSDIGEAISATTRKPRAGEKDGVQYHFKSIGSFQDMVKNDEFLEHAEFCGNLYGTLKSEVSRLQSAGKKTILLEIDCQGAESIRNNNKECSAKSIFILPPSLDVLEHRLRSRNTESNEDIEKRLKVAKAEMLQAEKFDYRVINNDLKEAMEEISRIYKAMRPIL